MREHADRTTMKPLIAIALSCAALCSCFAGDSVSKLKYKGDHGEEILTKIGDCDQHDMNAGYISKHHYKHGQVYGIVLFSGELVAPGGKSNYPTGNRIIWMCRYHVSEWIGTDPVTGKGSEWMPSKDANGICHSAKLCDKPVCEQTEWDCK